MTSNEDKDFLIAPNQSSRLVSNLVGLEAKSDAAKKWLAENVNADTWQFQGDTLYIDDRCVCDIVDGFVRDGLTWEEQS